MPDDSTPIARLALKNEGGRDADDVLDDMAEMLEKARQNPGRIVMVATICALVQDDGQITILSRSAAGPHMDPSYNSGFMKVMADLLDGGTTSH